MCKLYKFNDYLNESESNSPKLLIDKKLITELNTLNDDLIKEYDDLIEPLFEKYNKLIRDKISSYIPENYMIGSVNNEVLFFDENGEEISKTSRYNADENEDVLECIQNYQNPRDIFTTPGLIDMEIYGTK